jgi:transposase-like protein
MQVVKNEVNLLEENKRLMESLSSESPTYADGFEPAEPKAKRKEKRTIGERIEILAFVEKNSVAAGCEKYGCTPKQYYLWRNQYRSGVYDNLPTDQKQVRVNTLNAIDNLKEKIKGLEQENAELRGRLMQVNEFLKTLRPRAGK